MKALVFADKITSRVSYAVRLLFLEVLKVEVDITDKPEEYKAADGVVKVCYAHQSLGGLHIRPHGLLHEKGIREINISCTSWEGMTTFLPVKNADWPFDPFAAAFFLVSRYEEYLPHRQDTFQRFGADQSIAYKHEFLDQPVVDQWALKLKADLQAIYPHASFPQKEYRFLPTLDIDNAFAYSQKGIFRSAGGFFRAALNGDWEEVKERTQVLAGRKQDPFDTFTYLLEVHRDLGLRPLYFFLVGDYGVNDKNVPISSPLLQSRIKEVFDYCDVGIHPSFASNREPARLKMEIERLKQVIHSPIEKSRQHFLRLSFPETYRQLMEVEITDEYTMGYASQTGFRAGISEPFPFYDIDREITTALRIHPFQVMDATLQYYLKLNPEEALQAIAGIIEKIRSVQGVFTSLWHNESLSERRQWKGWRPVYEEMLKLAAP